MSRRKIPKINLDIALEQDYSFSEEMRRQQQARFESYTCRNINSGEAETGRNSASSTNGPDEVEASRGESPSINNKNNEMSSKYINIRNAENRLYYIAKRFRQLLLMSLDFGVVMK